MIKRSELSSRWQRHRCSSPDMASSVLLLLLVVVVNCVAALTLQNGYVALNVHPRKTIVSSGANNLLQRQRNPYCPHCDSSVFSYCSDKLLHDACCCLNPYQSVGPLPTECQYADCSFLHANTCQEHSLITACCCSSRGNFFK